MEMAIASSADEAFTGAEKQMESVSKTDIRTLHEDAGQMQSMFNQGLSLKNVPN